MKLTAQEYADHLECNDGYCPECDDFTRSGDTEPDAESYECPECEGNTCMGAAMALVADKLEIVAEENVDE